MKLNDNNPAFESERKITEWCLMELWNEREKEIEGEMIIQLSKMSERLVNDT